MFDLQTIDKGALEKALQAAESKLPQTAGDPMLLFKARQGNDGWLLGQEQTVVTGETVLLLAGSIERGWVAFDSENNKKLGEISAPLFSNTKVSPDALSELPNASVNEQTTAKVYFPKHKLQAALKGSTRGMESEMAGIIGQILNRMRAGEQKYLNPMLTLGVDSYQHSNYGKTFVPDMKVVAWCDASGNEEVNQEALQARV